ncbi:MAG: transcription repressor NadR [Peptoniphilus sp.]|nr:transcription repressor NadR [Peptoniphilus sp.]MDD7362646.1 transcription repressor NadR [Bacillota bacterium]MDY6044955.1 transcription repressor NadR [Peptoniphilus sp.]
MTQTKKERLDALQNHLSKAEKPVSGEELAKMFDVSRQVIVQDISLLRAKNVPILSTNRGYYMESAPGFRRVFKCKHRDDQIIEELNTIVDLGAVVEDVYVEHRIYGKISATMNVKSRKDVQNFMNNIYDSVSTPLKNITNGYHFHTVLAEDEETLDDVQDMLNQKGFLVNQ